MDIVVYDEITTQIGETDDAANINGSLNAKINFLNSGSFIPAIPFGDGSLGDVVISSNTTLGEFSIYQYDNLTINSGITLTAHRAIILVKDALTVNGLISATGKGGSGGAKGDSTGVSGATGGNGGAGGGFGAGGGAGGGGTKDGGNGGSSAFRTGGVGDSNSGNAGQGYSPQYAGMLDIPNLLLSVGGGGGGGAGGSSASYGGGNGGAGGGLIIIQAKNIVINSGGAIRADGVDGANTTGTGTGGGGGGGGGLILLQGQISNAGTISSTGGVPGTGGAYDGGAGGDGAIILWEAI